MERAHEDSKGLIAAYVLGALSDPELRDIRSHIMSCDECMAEVERLVEALPSLALSVAPAPLPDGFADRVMGRVAAEREVGRTTDRRSPRPRRPLAQVLSFGVLVLAVAVLSMVVVQTRREVAIRQKVIDALVRRGGGIALNKSGVTVARLVPAKGGALFVAAGLKSAPSGRTYQLWLMRGACLKRPTGRCDKVSAGTFDASGGVAVLTVARSLGGWDAAAVTVEPRGGSKQPTTPPVLVSV